MKTCSTWRELALWLADCHAATAGYEARLSRASASTKRRHAEICETASAAIESFEEPTGRAQRIVERLDRNAAALRDEVKGGSDA